MTLGDMEKSNKKIKNNKKSRGRWTRIQRVFNVHAYQMDILDAQLAAIQRKLSFVQEDPIDWQTYVLVFSWGICLFESYLLYASDAMCSFGCRRRSRHQHSPLNSLRQYPLYSKTTPPAVLADHFKPEVFEKCQKYGKHKAKFSIVSGLYRQVIDTVQLASGLYYPWAWKASGQLLGLAGYGPEYRVCPHGLLHGQLFEPTFLDFSIGCLCLCLDIHFHPSNFASWSISDLRPRGTAWFQ